MVVDQQQMLLAIHLQQPGPQQQAGCEIKGREELLLQPLLDHRSRIPGSQRFRFQGKGSGRVNDLNQLTVPQLKGGAEGGMALDQRPQGLLQSSHVERTAEPPEGGQVVGGEIRLQLMQEPEARLGVGGGKGPTTCWPGAGQGQRGGDPLQLAWVCAEILVLALQA